MILDSPPLLFAADANLLSTLCHGTLLVVRIGHTTIDSVTRAMQSLCNNNVLGIVVNGARRGELYSKYTYYHSYYTPKEAWTRMPTGRRISRRTGWRRRGEPNSRRRRKRMSSTADAAAGCRFRERPASARQ